MDPAPDPELRIDPDLIPDDIKDYLPQERPGTPSTVLSVDEFANLGWIHASASAVAVFNDLRYEDASEYLEPLVDLQVILSIPIFRFAFLCFCVLTPVPASISSKSGFHAQNC